MYIYLTSVYKYGSSGLYNLFHKNNYKCIYEEEYIINNNFNIDSDENTLVKLHTKNDQKLINKIKNKNFNLLITIIRNPLEIFISSYFQNLFLFVKNVTISYPYHLENKELYDDKPIDFLLIILNNLIDMNLNI